MAKKPSTRGGYPPETFLAARRVCLYLATKLGDHVDDLVVVGGLVPSLLVDQSNLVGDDRHAGTLDVDLGLAVGLLSSKRYQDLAARLREADLDMDRNERGNVRRQTWTVTKSHGTGTVDFLMAPPRASDRAGDLLDLEGDFAAIITPGLALAFRDRVVVHLEGETIAGERATRPVGVCGPAAYVLLKALAFQHRGANKDAYDLDYVLRRHDVERLAATVASLLDDEAARQAVAILRRDFTGIDGPGPRRVAAFVDRDGDDDLQQEVVGFVSRLLRRLPG